MLIRRPLLLFSLQVKIGAITHLGDFLGHLNPACRERYLPLLRELHDGAAPTNWRLRQLLASQYVALGTQYSAPIANGALAPLVLELLQDDVCVVRETAHTAIAVLIGHLKKEADQQWVNTLFASLVALASEQSYQERQVCRARVRTTVARSLPSPSARHFRCNRYFCACAVRCTPR
jgi:hypothetical protein